MSDTQDAILKVKRFAHPPTTLMFRILTLNEYEAQAIADEFDRLCAENAKLLAVAEAAAVLAEEDDRDVSLTAEWNALDAALATLDAKEEQ